VAALLAEMDAEVRAFVQQARQDAPLVRSLRAYMRYAGQGWEIPVAVPVERFDRAGVQALREAFVAEYQRLFGHAVQGLDAEVVSWALSMQTVRPAVERLDILAGAAAPADGTGTVVRRAVLDSRLGKWVDCAIHARASLAVGQRLAGPLMVVEPETSTYVSPFFALTVQADGSLLIVRQQETEETL
jgi:N-methylhydantoinase A